MMTQDNHTAASQITSDIQTGMHMDKETQDLLNKPLQLSEGMDPKDREFLELIVRLVNEGKINLYGPSTLINSEVYNKLDFEKQGKADFESVNLLAAIREIKGLYDAGYAETYQVINLVHRLRDTKERLEIEGGDLFII